MNDYVILTDSSCDLPLNLVEELDLHVVPLTVNFKGQQFRDLPGGVELDPKTFYAEVRGGEMPTTSAIGVGQWTDAMEPYLKEGKDVLVLGFSSGLSTTYQSAAIAANDLAALYPERKVVAVDTLCASLGQGLIVWHAAKRKAAGESLEAVRDWVEANKMSSAHWFTVDDLHHLKRGGRVSAATAVVGTLLGIKPVLHVDDEGHLISMSKSRGRKASLDALVTRMAETAIDPENQTVFISHGDCLEDAQYVANQVRNRLHVQDIVIHYIGPVIGAHAGPGCVALFFLASER